ncbi:CHC2 zinc finger domain-containing protein [Sphingobium sp. HBC34]|uniref:CHC2 zinc finger domain-containing protein n=1 Tax=Sphingobium cyanobacteriorum TaxID=3063954 RepID=A0ABT8ZSK4_9SPHN|nr:CHC2 zinc finger domain-containing protein [Sphingobium sp. HBC34]MDO7837512.1 CHC2 zinc finger domain-containing protein [Sphingobium sp. HBC34]
MARIPEAEIERLKSEVSLARLVESMGTALEKRGNDLVGRCPFHDEDTPSFVVTPGKNLFHCFGCEAAGGPIDWVMKRQGMSFRHAVEWLRDGAIPTTDKPVRRGARLPSPLQLDADDHALLAQVIDYYHDTLKQTPDALAYLEARGLANDGNGGALIERFRLGYANRTLGLRLPEKNRKAGADIRGRLEKIGLYRDTGHEHFNGSLVVPVLDERGRIQEVYGRKIRNDLRPGTPKHLYLPGPHRGVWNIEGVAGSKGEVILAESLIDAMTFWSAGYRNVTATYGTGGFTDDHLSAFRRYGVERVLIAFDRDEAGERAATALADTLMDAGFACYRILFPKGMDANAYALSVKPATRTLGLLIRKAQWLGNGKAPPITSARDAIETAMDALSLPISPDGAADDPPPLPEPTPEPTIAAVLPLSAAPDPIEAQSDHELVMMLGAEANQRRYRVRGWKKPFTPETMKVNLLVQRGAAFHVDTFDLYAAKGRAAFVKLAGIELGESEDVLKHDLGRVLLKLEGLQDAELSQALVKDERPALSDAEREEALALLKDPNLIARIRADFLACGMVGEETNALTGYLACVSRLLDRPLAVIIQSSSAAGKSAMMDAVLALMPQQAQVRYSAMTGQSLFYMGEANLKHRILAIAEEEGAASASYALKLLQSDGSVTIASTGKDAATGLLVTHEYRVEGPVMLFLTTTAIDIDEELLNRCMILSVNESREQTRAIHAAQRRRQTLEGLLEQEDRHAVLALHRNAQGMLDTVKVVNPFAHRLTFLDDKTRTRRDHMKYLTLIQAITLLHQHQRPKREVHHRGRLVHYIEVEASDIALANALANEVLGRTLDELPPQTRTLLHILHEWAERECTAQAIRRSDLRFTRRQVRGLTGWGDTQAKVHLARLAALEYLLIHRVKAGQGYAYELLYAGEGETAKRFLMGLSGPAPKRSAAGRGADGARSGHGRKDKIAEEPQSCATSGAPVIEDAPEALFPPADAARS